MGIQIIIFLCETYTYFVHSFDHMTGLKLEKYSKNQEIIIKKRVPIGEITIFVISPHILTYLTNMVIL